MQPNGSEIGQALDISLNSKMINLKKNNPLPMWQGGLTEYDVTSMSLGSPFLPRNIASQGKNGGVQKM